jgi:hypothetical protein
MRNYRLTRLAKRAGAAYTTTELATKLLSAEICPVAAYVGRQRKQEFESDLLSSHKLVSFCFNRDTSVHVIEISVLPALSRVGRRLDHAVGLVLRGSTDHDR